MVGDEVPTQGEDVEDTTAMSAMLGIDGEDHRPLRGV
jgi:hypothetical protein